MKREAVFSHITAAVLAWELAFCGVGCLISGFSLEGVKPAQMAALCGGAAVLGSVCLYWKRGGLVLLCAGALAAGFIWRGGTAWNEIKALAYQISSLYDNAYGWGQVDLGFPPDSGCAWPLGILGVLTALNVCRVMLRRKNALWAVFPAALPLAACLVVTDTVPKTGYLFGLLLGTLVLLMTDWVRRFGRAEDAWLAAALAIPTAAALGILFLAVPQKDYVNHVPELEGQLVSLGERLQSLTRTISQKFTGGADTEQPRRVDLETLGPRVQWNYTVMQVTSPTGGAVYLRGGDYNTYSGTGWIASENRTEAFSGGAETAHTLRIRTNGVKPVLFVPYYPAGEVTLTGGRLENGQNLTDYSFMLAQQGEAGRAAADAQYLQLPAETLKWAKALANEITAEQTTTGEKAQAIAAYVRSSAAYDLNTGRMNRDGTDFARWFLEESETGYCVHFATAATVLLRAAGIPARYVEGYLVTCRADEETAVTGEMAHAWAEYDSGGVWSILEATPSAPTEELSTVPPAQILPSFESTEPAESTRPPASRNPAQGGTSAPQPARKALPGWAKTTGAALMGAALASAAVWLQSELRIRRKRTAWNRGQPNQQALARWAQVRQLALVLHVPVPESLHTLAQKARFSQHTLTDGELAEFDAFRASAWAEAAPVNTLKKWLLRLVFAVE